MALESLQATNAVQGIALKLSRQHLQLGLTMAFADYTLLRNEQVCMGLSLHKGIWSPEIPSGSSIWSFSICQLVQQPQGINGIGKISLYFQISMLQAVITVPEAGGAFQDSQARIFYMCALRWAWREHSSSSCSPTAAMSYVYSAVLNPSLVLHYPWCS